MIGLVLVMLWLSFGVIRHALIIVVNVPLALIGGILGLFVTGQYLSVPASVGFIALFGIAVQNGMVLVTYFNDLCERGEPVPEAVKEGAELRLRPVLMTALYMGFYLGFLIFVQGMQARRDDLWVLPRWPWPARSLCYAYLFYAVVVFGEMQTRAFIYFQF